MMMMETWIRIIKRLVELMSVGKIHRVERLIMPHESLRFMHKPPNVILLHVIHHHHHSGFWGPEVAMGPRKPRSRWAHRADRSRTTKPAVRRVRGSGWRRSWCCGTHAMLWSGSRSWSIPIFF